MLSSAGGANGSLGVAGVGRLNAVGTTVLSSSTLVDGNLIASSGGGSLAAASDHGNGAVSVAGDSSNDLAEAGPALTPSIKVSPTQGPEGAKVTVSGAGFTASTKLKSLVFDSKTITSCTSGSLTASATGRFSCTFKVPSGTSGTTVKATDVSSKTATGSFTVTVPNITIAPTSGPVGTPVIVSGTGFSVSTKLKSLVFDSRTITSCASGSLTSNVTGAFSCAFNVPVGTSGTTVTATDAGGQTAPGTFAVTGATGIPFVGNHSIVTAAEGVRTVVSIPITVLTGSAVLVYVHFGTSTYDVSSIVDSFGNSLTRIGLEVGDSSEMHVELWAIFGVGASNSYTVTATVPAGTYGVKVMNVIEVRNATAVDAVGPGAWAHNTEHPQDTVSSPSGDDLLLLGVSYSGPNTTFTPNGTLIDTTFIFYHHTHHLGTLFVTQPLVTTTTVSATLSRVPNWAALAVAIHGTSTPSPHMVIGEANTLPPVRVSSTVSSSGPPWWVSGTLGVGLAVAAVGGVTGLTRHREQPAVSASSPSRAPPQ